MIKVQDERRGALTGVMTTRMKENCKSILWIGLLSMIFGIGYGSSAESRSNPGNGSSQTQPIGEKNPFVRSKIIPSLLSLREGDTIDYTVNIHYDGKEELIRIHLEFPLPGPAMLVSASPGLIFEENDRTLSWKGMVASGKDLVFKARLVTRPDCASNRTLFGSAGIYWEGGVHWLQCETEIHSKLRPDLDVRIGGLGIGRVELTILSYLVGGVLFVLIIPRIILWKKRKRDSLYSHPEKKHLPGSFFLYAVSFTVVVLIGIAHLMGHIVYEDFRRFYSYPETECILLDKKIIIDEAPRTTGKIQSNPTQYKEPLVAVRYSVDGREMIAAGPPQVTSMRSPLEKYAMKELAQYEPGRSYRCWYDPLDPGRFVLARGVSWGWYLLGIGPLVLLYFLVRNLLRKIFY
jgi:hypothetical protein